MSTDSYMTMKKRMKKQREDDFPMIGSVKERGFTSRKRSNEGILNCHLL